MMWLTRRVTHYDCGIPETLTSSLAEKERVLNIVVDFTLCILHLVFADMNMRTVHTEDSGTPLTGVYETLYDKTRPYHQLSTPYQAQAFYSARAESMCRTSDD
jgi:hypothetical protein